jgi:hypothetical protein
MIDHNFIFPQFQTDTINISKELNCHKNYIFNVQTQGSHLSDCYLSFDPVSKNLRFVSSYFFEGIKRGLIPRISSYCRNGEDGWWREKTGEGWYPWLWTRYFQNNSSNEQSWNNLFKPILDIVEIDSPDQSGALSDFYLYLACLDHTFRLNEQFENQLKNTMLNYDWPDQPVCALQIRRGEMVPKDGSVKLSWTGRPIYTVDDYMVGIDIVSQKLGSKHVFVSTDSQETIDYLNQNYSNKYNFFSNIYDRNLFIRYDGDCNSVHLSIDLQKQQNLIQHYTESCVSDLIALSKCNGYVGGMKHSEYGLTGWFLQMIKQQKITPYYNVEGDFNLNDQPVGMLLL